MPMPWTSIERCDTEVMVVMTDLAASSGADSGSGEWRAGRSLRATCQRKVRSHCCVMEMLTSWDWSAPSGKSETSERLQ